MAERSGFFNSVNGDRIYKAEDFAEYFNSFVTNGIFPNPSTNLQVIANNDMTVTLKAGKAWINGYVYINDSDKVLNIDVADGLLNRIDRIAIQLDKTNREIKAIVKKGQFAINPVAPELVRNSDYYELGIADIYISKGATSITQANITDLRLNNDYCGLVNSLIQADVTTLYNQYSQGFEIKKQEFEQAFNSWFENIQNILSGDVAGNLLNLINEKAPLTHTHTKADIIDFNHTHLVKDITNLDNSRFINNNFYFYRPSKAYLDDGRQAYNHQPRVSKNGLLIEEYTTNLLNDVNISNWTKVGTTVTQSGNYYEIKVDTSTGNHNISGSFAAEIGKKYTASIIVKKGIARYIGLSFVTYANWNGGIGGDTTFDLENGTITELGAEQAYIKKINDTDYKLTIICTNTSGTNFTSGLNVFIRQGSTRSGSNNSYTGDGTLNVYVKQPQVENKTFSTSFIDKTRNSEIVRIDKNNIPLEQGTIEARFYVKDELSNNVNWNIVFSTVYLDGATEKNQISFRKNNTETTKWGYVISNSAGNSKSNYVALSEGWHTFALKWNNQTQELWFFVDGVLTEHATNVTQLPDNYNDNVCYLGRWYNDAYHLNSYISHFHATTELLSDEEIYDRVTNINFTPSKNSTCFMDFTRYDIDNFNDFNKVSSYACLPASSFTSTTTSSSYTDLQKVNITIPEDGYYVVNVAVNCSVSSGTGKIKALVGSTTIGSELAFTNTSMTEYSIQGIIYLNAGVNTFTLQGLNVNSATTTVQNVEVRLHKWVEKV